MIRTSTTGYPDSTPFSSCARAPFSTEGMNWRGTDPPTTLSTNSTPPPRSSGSISMWQTAYWPCPPLCLTCRPWTVHLRTNVSRSAVRNGLGLDLDAIAVAQPAEDLLDVGLAHRPQHDLVGLRVVLHPHGHVLGDDPLQRARELVLVALVGGVDRHG